MTRIPSPLTNRFGGLPSPGGTHVAFEDKNNDLFVLDVEKGEEMLVSTSREGIRDFAWSPDGKWLCYAQSASNSFTQLWLYAIDTGTRAERPITYVVYPTNASFRCVKIS